MIINRFVYKLKVPHGHLRHPLSSTAHGLKTPDFISLIYTTWVDLQEWTDSSAILLLCEKLKYLKQVVVKWKIKKKQKMKVDLVHLEQKITTLFDNNHSHLFDAEDLNTL
jgi:hypothetical protein